MNLPKKIENRDGSQVGVVTGGVCRCQMEGCNGLRISVRWPDGKLTKPCSKGLAEITTEVWRIL